MSRAALRTTTQHSQGTDRGHQRHRKGVYHCKTNYPNSKCTCHICHKLAKGKEKGKQKEEKGTSKGRITDWQLLLALKSRPASLVHPTPRPSQPPSPTTRPHYTAPPFHLSSTHTPSTEWIYGLGASSYVTNNFDLFVNIRNFDKKGFAMQMARSHMPLELVLWRPRRSSLSVAFPL